MAGEASQFMAYSSSDEDEGVAAQPAATGLWGFVSRLTGTKPLTATDLAPVMERMRTHLIEKNVAAQTSVDVSGVLAPVML